MALKTKTRDYLYALHPYRRGRVEQNALRGFFHTCEKVQGQGVMLPDLQVTAFSALNTEQDVDASGAGRIYFLWIESPAASTLDTIVQVKDNDVVIASAKVKSTKSCEVYFFNGDDGVGIPYATDLEVQAVAAADGSSQPAAGDRPTVYVVWGDDAINTDEKNLLVATYG